MTKLSNYSERVVLEEEAVKPHDIRVIDKVREPR